MFKVADLMINVLDERLRLDGGDTGLCAIEQPTQDMCGLASPYMYVAKLTPRFELVRGLVAAGTPESLQAAQKIAGDVTAALVGAFLPADEGTPVPTPITPVATGVDLLSMADLPAIRASLQHALAEVEKLEVAAAPRPGAETEIVREHLAAALESLGGPTA